jgi:hypothetical protein
VRDPSGALIPGATVTAEEPQTGLRRTSQSDSEGRYVIPSLRPTVYVITVETSGFKKFTQTGIELLANQSASLNVTLELGAVSETITVEGAAAQVDTTTSTLKEVID